MTYKLNSEGQVIAWSIYNDLPEALNGSEPFTSADITDYRKDLTTGEWIFCPPAAMWHEPNMPMQIVMTFEQSTKLVGAYPEIAAYRKANNIVTYYEYDGTYVYVNWLLPEHKALFEAFGAIIKTKE